MLLDQTPLQVLIMPDYRADNPYQSLLSNALQAQGAEVRFPLGYRRIFPLFREKQSATSAINVLHIHWIDQYIKGETWLIKLAYGIKFLLDVLLVKISGCRVVWTIHNTVSHNAKFPRVELWIQQKLIRLVHSVIVHNRAALEEVSTAYRFDKDKASVIPHGHYRNIYKPAIEATQARSVLGLPEQGRVYLNLGMLKPYKGIESLLRTWSKQEGNRTLLIVGKAQNEEYGRALLQQAQAIPSVILRNGFVEDDQLHLYFSAADVVLLPFNKILTSGSLILAMSYGKPVIAPNIGSISETLGEATTLLYDSKDLGGLSKAIEASANTCLKTIERQVVAACDRLSWRYIAEETYKLYRPKNHAA